MKAVNKLTSYKGYTIDAGPQVYDESGWVTSAAASIYLGGEFVDEEWLDFEPEEEYDADTATREVLGLAKDKINAIIAAKRQHDEKY